MIERAISALGGEIRRNVQKDITVIECRYGYIYIFSTLTRNCVDGLCHHHHVQDLTLLEGNSTDKVKIVRVFINIEGSIPTPYLFHELAKVDAYVEGKMKEGIDVKEIVIYYTEARLANLFRTIFGRIIRALEDWGGSFYLHTTPDSLVERIKQVVG